LQSFFPFKSIVAASIGRHNRPAARDIPPIYPKHPIPAIGFVFAAAQSAFSAVILFLKNT